MTIEIQKTATINADADRLWTILGDEFTEVSRWASAVDSSVADTNAEVLAEAEVGGRVCEVPGFGTINETLTSFEPTERSYAFTATASKIPSFVSNIVNHTKITPIDDQRSELTIRITAEASGLRGAVVRPMMARKFGATLDGLIDDVRVFAETGDVSADKTEALAKAGR